MIPTTGDRGRWRGSAPGRETDNAKATKYQKRTTDIRNLEASNQLFIEFVEELHRRGMKIILDGVFNHCGSFNKWMDRERIYEDQEDYELGLLSLRTARSAVISVSSGKMRKTGLITCTMMDGGGMIPFPN